MADPSLQGVTMSEVHYTAVIQVHKVTREAPPANQPTVRYNDPTPPIGEKRETTEVANVVIRAKTLAALKDKVNGHVALVSED